MNNTVNEKNEQIKDELNEEIESNLQASIDEIENQIEEENEPIECKDKEELNQTVDLKKEIEEYKERFSRLSADFQNYKRRIEKEKSEIYKFGSEKIVVDILPIIDNFERAIQASKDNNEGSGGLLDGIQMIFKQFIEVFEKHGVEEIEAIGKEFDPNLHHAVMQEECEGEEANIVIEVFQKGYMLNSKVIRPSMVKVSK